MLARSVLGAALVVTLCAEARAEDAAEGGPRSGPDGGVQRPPPEAVRENMLTLQYAKAARDAARANHCDVVRELAPKVQAIDDVFYQHLFVVDPPIAACLTGRPVPGVAYPAPGPPPDEIDRSRPPTATTKRIFGELAVGLFVGGGGALIGALIGNGVCDDDNCAIGGAYIAGIATIPLGVYAIGKHGEETGSLGMTYLGALAGGLGGLALAIEDRDTITTIGMILGPMVGAVVGFNATRRYRPRVEHYGSLLQLRGGRVGLGVPVVTRVQTAERAVTNVPLLGGTF